MANLIAYPIRCCGCQICELACTMAHEGIFNPRKARIRVDIRRRPDLNTPLSQIDVPIICKQCDPAPCAEVCPQDAFFRDRKIGALLIDEEKCNGCGLCIEECPEGILKLDLDRNIAIKCDLCSGSPECVKYCPTGALDFKI